MSNEVGLTDKERAILAGLAEKVATDDPGLANTLRGGRLDRLDRLKLPEMPAFVQHSAFGVVCAIVGLVVVLVAISTSIVLGVVGLLFTALGVVLALSAWRRRAIETHAGSPQPPSALE
jgi:hypothetical protein